MFIITIGKVGYYFGVGLVTIIIINFFYGYCLSVILCYIVEMSRSGDKCCFWGVCSLVGGGERE